MASRLEPELVQLIEEIIAKRIREELEARSQLITVDKFTQAMNRIDARFTAQQQQSETLQRQMDERFTAQQQQSETLQRQMDERFTAQQQQIRDLQRQMDERFAALIRDNDRGHLLLKAAIDNLGSRSGVALENAVLELLDDLLVKRGVDYKVVARQQLVDRAGAVFFPGFATDVDVVARDGEVHLFEVKYKADQRDFDHFLRVARLYEAVEGQKPSKLFLVTLEVTRATLRAVAHLPVEVIAGTVVD